jgi:hypothetical protein
MKVKKKYSHFDKFLVNIFFNMNILKTCNKMVKTFMNFLSSLYCRYELLIYLCLRNISIINNHN